MLQQLQVALGPGGQIRRLVGNELQVISRGGLPGEVDQPLVLGRVIDDVDPSRVGQHALERLEEERGIDGEADAVRGRVELRRQIEEPAHRGQGDPGGLIVLVGAPAERDERAGGGLFGQPRFEGTRCLRPGRQRVCLDLARPEPVSDPLDDGLEHGPVGRFVRLRVDHGHRALERHRLAPCHP